MEKTLDNILNASSKVKIIRFFTSKRADYFTTGREISKQIGLSAPATHSALKDLYSYSILNRDIIGKQHLYRLNINNRTVKDILIPAFKKELSTKKDISEFLKDEIINKKLKDKIISLVIYGSIEKGTAKETSDVDIAIIVKTKKDKQYIENIFLEDISTRFTEYFGAQLDTYTKTRDEFTEKLQKNKPPVSTLIKAYRVIYGKDPLNIKKYDSKKNQNKTGR